MFNTWYICDKEGRPFPVDRNTQEGNDAYEEWAASSHHRRVAETRVGKYIVSTVFLGLDHGWDAEGDPVLWETMVFGGGAYGVYSGEYTGDDDRLQARRYTSKAEAQAGHDEAVSVAKKVLAS